MWFGNFFHRRAKQNDEHALAAVQEISRGDHVLAKIPEGAEIVSDDTEIVETPDHPEMCFERRTIIYTTNGVDMRKIFVKKNVQALGCGHNLSRSVEIAYKSDESGLPVCSKCEAIYNQYRHDTRHEDCPCNHLVAPRELTYVEGHGYLCPTCLKEFKKFDFKAAARLIFGLLLKPLINFDEKKSIEVTYENIPPRFPPSARECPPVVHGSSFPRPGDPPENRPYHEVAGSKPRQPQPYRIVKRTD